MEHENSRDELHAFDWSAGEADSSRDCLRNFTSQNWTQRLMRALYVHFSIISALSTTYDVLRISNSNGRPSLVLPVHCLMLGAARGQIASHDHSQARKHVALLPRISQRSLTGLMHWVSVFQSPLQFLCAYADCVSGPLPARIASGATTLPDRPHAGDAGRDACQWPVLVPRRSPAAARPEWGPGSAGEHWQ